MRQPILPAALPAVLPALAAATALTLAGPLAAEAGRAPKPSASRPVATAPAAATPSSSKPPPLVVAISVDQFSADLFSEYRQRYSGGLARLQQGAVFPQGFQSHAATETCPGHSTLLTGARPARTGIIANNWYDPARKGAEKIYCSEDESRSKPGAQFISPAHLLVPTLGERLKGRYPGSLNVAVSGKDRAVAMMGGQKIDAGYWWKGGGFTSYPGRALSPAVTTANTELAAMLHAGAAAYPVPAWCAAREVPLDLGTLTIGTEKFALAADAPDAFRVSPRLDEATADLALKVVDELKLGTDDMPDVLSVSFSANDYVGHAYGTEGVEMCIQQAALDRTIGRLLDGLDQRGIDYLVVLSADHGGMDVVERLKLQGYGEAARALEALTPEKLGESVSRATGVASASGKLVWGDGAGGDYYIARDIPAPDRAKAIAELAGQLRAHAQVAAVFTADELAAIPLPKGSPQDFTLAERARASFYPGRSGDVVALLKRGIVGMTKPGRGYTATHGSPWDYDRRVPILFWRKGMTGFEQPAPVETVDIAPTLAAVLGLTVPASEFDGRCLDLDAGAGDTCAAQP